MKNKQHFNLVSFVIPTLNSGSVLQECLKSIRNQNYPQTLIEIIISDGGSTDKTINIAKTYDCQIIKNDLKTAESGKALGIKISKGKYIALIDSDNILPDSDWLSLMLQPFKDTSIIGTEPWEYTYRPNGGFIERYSSLTGVNDPYALIAKNYDRKNFIRKNWNGLNIKVKDHLKYQSFTLSKGQKLPSIGANGTIYLKKILDKYLTSDYLIDVDFLTNILSKTQKLSFAKVKCGIIHSYCESSITKFIKKQKRRVTDLYIYQQIRPKNFIASHFNDTIIFTLYIILIIPMSFDTIKGFIKKPDSAWFFHPVACILTWWTYFSVTIKYKFHLLEPVNRDFWQQ